MTAAPARLLILALLLPLAACGGGEAPSTPAAGNGPSVSAQTVLPGMSLSEIVEGFASHDYQGGVAVLDRLAEPLQRSAEPIANRHVEGQTDTVRTWTYSGLVLSVYDIAGDPKQLPQSIRATSGDYATAEGVRVGSRRAEVTTALGEPDRIEGGDLVYVLGADQPVPTGMLYVTLDAERVQALTWTFPMD